MIPRYYFDTSVFGGVFDSEFEYYSLLVFEKLNMGAIHCLYSDLTEAELTEAPERVKEFFRNIDERNTKRVEVDQEAIKLANGYIEWNVVGPTSLDDCIHIALATIHKADALISWNFKHIVNSARIPGYNSVNLHMGYKAIEICSPKTILKL